VLRREPGAVRPAPIARRRGGADSVVCQERATHGYDKRKCALAADIFWPGTTWQTDQLNESVVAFRRHGASASTIDLLLR
jgi:hypothetical protein